MDKRPDIVVVVDLLLDYFEMEDSSWPSCSVINSDGYHSGLVEDKLYQALIDLQEFSNAYRQKELEALEDWHRPVQYASKHYHLWKESDD